MIIPKARNFVSIMTILLSLFTMVVKQHGVSGEGDCECTNTSVALSNCTEFRCPGNHCGEHSLSRNLSCLCHANSTELHESDCQALILNHKEYITVSCTHNYSFICVDKNQNFQIYSEENVTWENAVNRCIERDLHILTPNITVMPNISWPDNTTFWIGQFFGVFGNNISAKCNVERENRLIISSTTIYTTSALNSTSDLSTTAWTNSSFPTTTPMDDILSTTTFISSSSTRTSGTEQTSITGSSNGSTTSTTATNEIDSASEGTTRSTNSNGITSENPPSSGFASTVTSFPSTYTPSTTIGQVHSRNTDILLSNIPVSLGSVPTTTIQSSESSNHGENNGSNIGVIIGPIIGGIVVIAITVFVILQRKRIAKKKSKNNAVPMTDIVSTAGYSDTSLKGQNKDKKSRNPIYLPEDHIPRWMSQNEDESNYDLFQSKKPRPKSSQENDTYNHMSAVSKIDANGYGIFNKSQGKNDEGNSIDVYDHTSAVTDGIYNSNSTNPRPLTGIYDSTIPVGNDVDADARF